jgi:hypothetical protein
MRRHDDPFRSRDQRSSLVYNEFMHAWVTYELVQLLYIYGLTPLVRSNLKDVPLDLFKLETFLRDRTNQDGNDSKHAESMIKRLFADTEHSAIFKKNDHGKYVILQATYNLCYTISSYHMVVTTGRTLLSKT